jgi:hypothetical protein
MRMTIASLSTNVAILTVLGLPSLAAAQDAAPAAPAPAATTAAPAAAPAPAAPATPAAPAPEAAAAAPAAPAAEAPKPIPSYFRIDQDYLFGTQLWAGATYPLSDTIGLAADIYMPENYVGASATGAAQSWWSEFDIGPAFTAGPLTLTPMAGIAFDWYAKRAVALNVPQLYTVVNTDKIYFESWIWTVLYSPFKNPVQSDYFHTRDWVLYKVNSTISVGPQFEFTYNLNTAGSTKKGTVAAPLGAHVELAFGAGNSLGLFAGYNLNKTSRDAYGGNGAEGRVTFVHNF